MWVYGKNQTFPELLTADLTRAEGTTYICHSPIKQLESYKTTTNLINTEHFIFLFSYSHHDLLLKRIQFRFKWHVATYFVKSIQSSLAISCIRSLTFGPQRLPPLSLQPSLGCTSAGFRRQADHHLTCQACWKSPAWCWYCRCCSWQSFCNSYILK